MPLELRLIKDTLEVMMAMMRSKTLFSALSVLIAPVLVNGCAGKGESERTTSAPKGTGTASETESPSNSPSNSQAPSAAEIALTSDSPESAYASVLNAWVSAPPCSSGDWKPIPTKFEGPTLVIGKCLQAVGKIEPGTTPVVVVARELRVGPQAEVWAGGPDGETGKRNGPPPMDVFPHGKSKSDDHCLCGQGKTHLYGPPGSPGLPGGSLRLIAREAVAAPSVKITIAGGLQGDHGVCGTVDCPKYPESSGPCCDPNYKRVRAAAGTAYFAFGGPAGKQALANLKAGVVTLDSPTNAKTVVARQLDADVAFVDQALSEIRNANGADYHVVQPR